MDNEDLNEQCIFTNELILTAQARQSNVNEDQVIHMMQARPKLARIQEKTRSYLQANFGPAEQPQIARYMTKTVNSGFDSAKYLKKKGQVPDSKGKVLVNTDIGSVIKVNSLKGGSFQPSSFKTSPIR